MAAKDLGKTCWSTISHAMSIFNTVIMKGRLQKPALSAFDAGPSLKWSFWTHIWYSFDFSCARATVGMCAIIIPCRHDWPTCQHEAGWWVLPSDSRAEAVFFVAGSREIGMSYAHRPCHGPQRLFLSVSAKGLGYKISMTWLEEVGLVWPGWKLKRVHVVHVWQVAGGAHFGILCLCFFFCVDEFVYILKMSIVFATLPGLR